jgi:hypothetical protein
MEPNNLEHIRDLADKELDQVCGGANKHPVATHAVTGKTFRGNPKAYTPGAWGTPGAPPAVQD